MLHRQCRSILSPSSVLYRRNRPLPLNSRRTLHTTLFPRQKEPIDDADPDVDDSKDLALDESEDERFLEQNSIGRNGRGFRRPRSRLVQRPPKPRRSLEEIDRTIGSKELGYDFDRVRNKAKRNLIVWLEVHSAKQRHYPQHLIMDLEERRVEKARERAEKRMFTGLNDFYDSLSVEEIVQKKLNLVPVSLRDKYGRKYRPPQPEPTPLSQLLNGQIPTALSKQEIESNVLSLLDGHNPYLHKLYREYVRWSDYKLQKQTIWFQFPDTQDFAEVVARLRGIDTQLEPEGDKKFDDDSNSEVRDKHDVDEDHKKGDKKVKSVADDDHDLSKYFGRPVPYLMSFPVVPIESSHYLGKGHPFPLNGTFRPGRPVPHETRLKMFDAWREGLGLRNTAWIGGVSWRRADAIVGILKREWQYVDQVFPSSHKPEFKHDDSI